MSVNFVLGRLYAFAGVKDVSHADPVFEGVSASGWGRLMGRSRVMDGLTGLRHALFCVVAVALILLFAAISNPTESSFRSHLTELSFRRHLVDIRSSDDASVIEEEPMSTPERLGSDTPVTPFRFSNHVAISLRTPTLLYKTFLLFSLAFTSPLIPPAFLSDPVPMKSSKQASCPTPRDRILIFFGFMGHWVLIGQVPRRAEWIWRVATEGGKEKGRKKGAPHDKPGVIEMRAIPGKEDPSPGAVKTAIVLQSAAKLIRKADSVNNITDHTLPLHSHPAPISVPPLSSDSLRPSNTSLSPPAADLTVDLLDTSPVITTLKSDLTSAQAALADLESQLLSHEESGTDSHARFSTTLEELRQRRKEDDADRQDLKSKTKSLEEQKRQAEAARRDAEKKLRLVEGVRDGLGVKISGALHEIEELRGSMGLSERNVRVMQEESARYVVETREAMEGKQRDLVDIEAQLCDLDNINEELVRQVKDSEERLHGFVEQGEVARRTGPEEEMMMMAAAYEVAAQEGYLHGHQHDPTKQWANQAAAYMAEAGMPYLDQMYTARPPHPTSRAKQVADISGFEDFGPGTAAQADKGTTTPPISDSESDIYGHDPGSPNGGISSSFSANLLPLGLFRSLEGDQTPVEPDSYDDPLSSGFEKAPSCDPPTTEQHADAPESGSESSDEHDLWRSPSLVEHDPKAINGSRLAPPSTTPPSAPSLPGLPAISGSRRWLSGTSSAENINQYTFMQPTSSTSNDSLNLVTGYEASPFAPSASEKKALALKWGPLSRYRWAGVNRDTPGPPGPGQSSPVELGASGSGWLSSRFSGSHNSHGNGNGDEASDANANSNSDPSVGIAEQSGEEDERLDKKPFRFFSLRKPRE